MISHTLQTHAIDKSLTEIDFHNSLKSFNAESISPVAYAVYAGVRADRPAYSFIAGYQSAIRWCFNHPDLKFNGNPQLWLSLAVSELAEPLEKKFVAKEDKETGAVTLNGLKTWIGAINHISQIIVKANVRDETIFLLVDREQSGLHLTPFDTSKVFSDMSQGQAYFEDVVVTNTRRVETSRIPFFSNAEKYFFTISLLSMMWNTASQFRMRRLVDDCENLFDQFEADVFSYLGIKKHGLPSDIALKIQEIFLALLESLDEELSASWRNDHKAIERFLTN